MLPLKLSFILLELKYNNLSKPKSYIGVSSAIESLSIARTDSRKKLKYFKIVRDTVKYMLPLKLSFILLELKYNNLSKPKSYIEVSSAIESLSVARTDSRKIIQNFLKIIRDTVN